MPRKRKPAINKKNVNKYITEGLLNRYRSMAETDIVRVPPLIYKLLVFAGELEELREEYISSSCCDAGFDEIYMEEMLMCPECKEHCSAEITPAKLIEADQINVADGHWLNNDFSIIPRLLNRTENV